MDRLPVEPRAELVLLSSGTSLGLVESPRVQAMLERMAVGAPANEALPTSGCEERDQVTRSTDV